MLFVVIAVDRPGCFELRMATRDAHFAYARATGAVKLGGPFLDGEGNMTGSMMIVEADDLDAAKQWARNDPYAKAGLFAQSDVRPWTATFNPHGTAL